MSLTPVPTSTAMVQQAGPARMPQLLRGYDPIPLAGRAPITGAAYIGSFAPAVIAFSPRTIAKARTSFKRGLGTRLTSPTRRVLPRRRSNVIFRSLFEFRTMSDADQRRLVRIPNEVVHELVLTLRISAAVASSRTTNTLATMMGR
jgi:hypothetical protein